MNIATETMGAARMGSEPPLPGSGALETQFADYRQVDGMTMPFMVKTVAAGMTLNEMRLDKIEVNVPIADAVFTIK